LEDGEAPYNLGNYALIQQEYDVIEALNEGLKDAQRIFRILNMALLSVAHEKQWFLTPWVVKKTNNKSFAYTPAATLVRGKDGNSKVLRVALEGYL
jgi:hypothetical protein